MKKLLFVVLMLLLVPSLVQAQSTVVKNPTAVVFTPSADHANPAVTGYELDFVSSTGAVVQTITIAKSALTTLSTGELTTVINVQPVNFGAYTAKMRTVAGSIKGDDSLASNVWERAPGAPSKPTLK
jgi:hypothetical protein